MKNAFKVSGIGILLIFSTIDVVAQKTNVDSARFITVIGQAKQYPPFYTKIRCYFVIETKDQSISQKKFIEALVKLSQLKESLSKLGVDTTVLNVLPPEKMLTFGTLTMRAYLDLGWPKEKDILTKVISLASNTSTLTYSAFSVMPFVEAVENARLKAEAAAKKLGLKLGRTVSIQEDSSRVNSLSDSFEIEVFVTLKLLLE